MIESFLICVSRKSTFCMVAALSNTQITTAIIISNQIHTHRKTKCNINKFIKSVCYWTFIKFHALAGLFASNVAAFAPTYVGDALLRADSWFWIFARRLTCGSACHTFFRIGSFFCKPQCQNILHVSSLHYSKNKI